MHYTSPTHVRECTCPTAPCRKECTWPFLEFSLEQLISVSQEGDARSGAGAHSKRLHPAWYELPPPHPRVTLCALSFAPSRGRAYIVFLVLWHRGTCSRTSGWRSMRSSDGCLRRCSWGWGYPALPSPHWRWLCTPPRESGWTDCSSTYACACELSCALCLRRVQWVCFGGVVVGGLTLTAAFAGQPVVDCAGAPARRAELCVWVAG